MKNLLITLCLLAVFVEVSGLFWSGRRDAPGEAFLRLSQPPDTRVDSPLSNGYFLLLGMASDASTDPVQAGYEIWLEAETHKGHRFFDLQKNGRGALRVSLTPSQVVPEWTADDPVTALGRSDAAFRESIERYAVLTARYERWLDMTFEDWGFSHPGSPRATEVLVAHRLFVAGGFLQSPQSGFQRLYRDTVAWRRVLAEAKTLPIKLLALTVVDENIGVLSRALVHPSPDKHIFALARLMARGLSAEEETLRWPIQHEFALGLAKRADRLSVDHYVGVDDAEHTRHTLASFAGLHEEALDRVMHPPAKTILGMTLESQRSWDAYATFYDATIKASETVHSPMPRWSDVNRSSSRTLLESVFTSSDFEPSWEPITQRILETDARLRLTGLQVALRSFASKERIGEQISLAGPEFFDPFSGLPMLWNATQSRLYSVGKDGLDDGGDSTFDIVTTVVLSTADAAEPGTVTSNSRAPRPRARRS